MAGPMDNPSLGEFLRQEREKRGITIEQVASATKIAVRLLHLLEADQYSELPAKPFIRGFVVSYVRFIGLDAKEVLTRFGDFIEAKAHDRPTREEGHSGYAFEKREGEQSRTVLWLVMGGFLLIGAVVFVFIKPSLKHHHGSHAEKLRSAHVLPSPSEAASPSPSPSPLAVVIMASPSPIATAAVHEPVSAPQASYVVPVRPLVEISPMPVTKPGAPKPTEVKTSPNDPLNSGLDMNKEDIHHRAVFRALEDVWVRYQVDNRKPMRFILRKDKVLVLRAQDAIRFQTSDPDEIRFSYNGGASKVMSQEKNAVMRQGDLTLFFPKQLTETIAEPFPGAKSIGDTPVPAPAAHSPSATSGE